MRYGRRERGRPRARRASYLRDVRYEVAKDGVGRATEFVGAGIGFAVGLTAARYGVPLPPTLAAGGGAGLGVLTALTGKAFITVGIDRVKDQRGGAAPDGTVGEHIASIRVVRQRIHRQRRRLHQLLGTLRGTHDAVKVLLRGGRPDLQRHVHANLHAVRDGVAESLALLGLVDDDLRTYQSSR